MVRIPSDTPFSNPGDLHAMLWKVLEWQEEHLLQKSWPLTASWPLTRCMAVTCSPAALWPRVLPAGLRSAGCLRARGLKGRTQVRGSAVVS